MKKLTLDGILKHPTPDELQGLYPSSLDWLSIKDSFIGSPVELDIATPDGLQKVTGRLSLLTYPFQILVEKVPEEIIESLRYSTNSSELVTRPSGKYQLVVHGKAWFPRGPKMTVRAYFTAEEHAVQSIVIRNQTIFQNRNIPDIYKALNPRAEHDLRVKIGYPIPSNI